MRLTREPLLAVGALELLAVDAQMALQMTDLHEGFAAGWVLAGKAPGASDARRGTCWHEQRSGALRGCYWDQAQRGGGGAGEVVYVLPGAQALAEVHRAALTLAEVHRAALCCGRRHRHPDCRLGGEGLRRKQCHRRRWREPCLVDQLHVRGTVRLVWGWQGCPGIASNSVLELNYGFPA